MAESAEAHRRNRAPPASTVALAVVALTVAALSLEPLALLARGIIDLPRFDDVGYPDSAMVLRIQRFVDRGELFPPLDRPPYLVTVYGPLTYGFLAGPYLAARTFGVDPVLALRLTQAVLLFACVGVIGVITHRFSGSRTVAFVATLFAVAGPALRPWLFQLRGDFLGLLLALSCIALCMRGGGARVLVAAAVLAGFAILSKQTFIAAPAAVVLWLLWQRRFRTAAMWAAIVFAVVCGAYGLALLREPELMDHLAALASPVFAHRSALWFTEGALLHPKALWSFAGAAVLLRSADANARLLLLYWALSWCVAIATVPQIGGNINYFWEPWFVSSVLAAVAIGAIMRAAAGIPIPAAIALVVFHLTAVAGDARTAYGELLAVTAERTRTQARDDRMRELAGAVRGYHLLSSSPLITRLSAVPIVPDPFLASVLVRAGSWDPEPLQAEVRSGEFDAVIGYGLEDTTSYRGLPRWDPLRLEAGRHPYRIRCVVLNYRVWISPSTPPELLRRLAGLGCG